MIIFFGTFQYLGTLNFTLDDGGERLFSPAYLRGKLPILQQQSMNESEGIQIRLERNSDFQVINIKTSVKILKQS